jgi:hypothetical protein
LWSGGSLSLADVLQVTSKEELDDQRKLNIFARRLQSSSVNHAYCLRTKSPHLFSGSGAALLQRNYCFKMLPWQAKGKHLNMKGASRLGFNM